MGVQAHEVEARRPRLGEMGAVDADVRHRRAGKRIDVVIAEAADEERAVVEVELLAAHLELPDAEALAPGLHHLAADDQLDLRRVKVGAFRRPGTEVGERDSQNGFSAHARYKARRGCGELRPFRSFNRHASDGDIARDYRRAHFHAHLSLLLVEVAAHPGVIDKCLRRRLDLDVAVDPTPLVHRAHQPLARRLRVRDLGDDDVLRAELDEVGYLVLLRPAVVVDARDRPPVEVEPPRRLDAADLQPNALAAPFLGDHDCPAVAAPAHELVADRLVVLVAQHVPALAHPLLADALCLPHRRHADLPLPAGGNGRDVWLEVIRLRELVGGSEIPFAAERDRVLLAEDRVHHRRMPRAESIGDRLRRHNSQHRRGAGANPHWHFNCVHHGMYYTKTAPR